MRFCPIGSIVYGGGCARNHATASCQAAKCTDARSRDECAKHGCPRGRVDSRVQVAWLRLSRRRLVSPSEIAVSQYWAMKTRRIDYDRVSPGRARMRMAKTTVDTP